MDTKYFKLEIQITENGVSLLPGDAKTKDAAITEYYSALASLRTAVDAGSLEGATCMVINTLGGVDPKYCEHYPDNVVTPEPEE